jgi:acyl-CoA synthetase (AMP-forming)/AMP-acid ligase II
MVRPSPPISQTVHGLLGATAARRPDESVRFPSERETVTYRELSDSARALAGELAAEGVRPGACVGVLSPNAPEYFQSLFAVSAAGAAACPLPVPSGPRDAAGYGRQLSRIAAASGMRLVLVSPRLGALAGQLAGALPGVRLRPAACRGTPAAALPAVTEGDDAIVQFTSGSTAQPKGVRLTHRNVLAGLAAIRDGIALGDADGGGFWLPLFHDMGLFGVMSGIQAGIPMYVWSPVSFIKSPARWLREFLASGSTITAMPDFGYAMLTAAVPPEEAASLDMARWRVAFNGSEPIAAGTVAAFTERFAPSGFPAEAMFCVYGMAEATLAVTFPPLGRGPAFDWVDRDVLSAAGRAVPARPGARGSRPIAGVGYPVAGLDLRLADPATGAPVPDGTVGEILIKGASVTVGYLGQAAGEIADGWLRTGDLGYVRDKEVFVTGRCKEMITVRGANFYPQDVELIARSVPGVYRGNCAVVTGAGGRRRSC